MKFSFTAEWLLARWLLKRMKRACERWNIEFYSKWSSGLLIRTYYVVLEHESKDEAHKAMEACKRFVEMEGAKIVNE